MSPITTTPCPNCGEPLSTDVIFCEHCFTMNPMVREFLKNNPKQHPIDYLTLDSTCPLCGKNQPKRVIDQYLPKKLRTPIHHCKKCDGYYVKPGTLEWCVAPSASKRKMHLLNDLLGRNELNIMLALIDSPLICAATAFLYLLLHYPIGILWLSFSLPKGIRASDLRLKHNRDYPQILASMGYGAYMDEQYNTLSDTPPKKQSIKEFLKEAFTFD